MKKIKTSGKVPGKMVSFEMKVTQQTKDANGDLYIEGYANTVDKDRVGDVILPIAFQKSLPTYLDNPVLLYQHNWENIIGKVVHAEITEKGLFIKAVISNADDCKDVRLKIREGILCTLSIGYNEVDSSYNNATETRVVKELDLLEISVVTIPANTQSKFKPVEAAKDDSNAGQKGCAVMALFGCKGNQASNLGTQTTCEGEDMKTKSGSKPGETKADPGQAPADGTPPADGSTAPAVPPKKDETPAADQGAKVIELLSGIMGQLEKLNANMEAMKGCKPKDETPPAKAADGETPPPAGDTTPPPAAPATEAKSFDQLSADEQQAALAELSAVTAELEALQG